MCLQVQYGVLCIDAITMLGERRRPTATEAYPWLSGSSSSSEIRGRFAAERSLLITAPMTPLAIHALGTPGVPINGFQTEAYRLYYDVSANDHLAVMWPVSAPRIGPFAGPLQDSVFHAYSSSFGQSV